ncbi:putative transcriptional regulatory protein C1F7.11c 3 [Colletotrichum chlorophyti]|uniref:Putative transcriptional regulatory protein C1F7.11c 3 n=1 Tax=Colletotrichum chlorophyti TaxID=708187 RepID=A0A1Q8RCN7_9PEZI|nr:putative transcriptional regulatory protein C1F7.11c 3 [Colletotrichum chlorophyti]
MDPEQNVSPPGPSSTGSGTDPGPAAPKRPRVLLSCGPCRASKLKCDRSEPCGQCLKKSRPEACVYAPKPDKKKPAKGMAARLKRLEGMVRTMMDEGVGQEPSAPAAAAAAAAATKDDDVAQPGGQFVRGDRGATYVGATHFMAILEDIEDMKSYFEEPDVADDESPGPSDDVATPSDLLLSRNAPRSREELLRLIPEKKIVDRLVMRYFSSHSPSQHIVHRPTFVKQYAHFWRDPASTSNHWLALLFMITSLGIFYSMFLAPHELAADTPYQPPMSRFKILRAAAANCLVAGRYTQPTITTIPPFILYVEAEFLISRAAQTNCYLLSSVCLRMLLKMGLHRDPDRLADVSPFEGEMRRRMWNMAVQLDLLVSFHMGLPSMLNGIDSDCALPRNLVDEDFAEDSPSLPPARPMTDYTEMTYPINKGAVMLVFGQVARQAHLLAPPPYSEIMRLDSLLNDVWAQVPAFLMVKPLEQCVTIPPTLVTQRFGIASLYNKTRCVLHRRFLLEEAPGPEHDYSRWQCVEGAMTLLEFQDVIWRACQPGNMLSQNGWFMSSLAVHDFMLAAIIVYLTIGNERFWDGGEHGWMDKMDPRPTRGRLLHMLQRSYTVWLGVGSDVPECKKTADVLETMLTKLGSPPNSPPEDGDGRVSVSRPQLDESSAPNGRSLQDHQLFDSLSISDSSSFPSNGTSNVTSNVSNTLQTFDFVSPGQGSSDDSLDRGWITVGNEMDWRYFDNIMGQTNNDPVGLESLDADEPWYGRAPAPNDMFFAASGAWDPRLQGRPG